MSTKQYIKQLNGYYIKDEEARDAIENANIPQRPYFFVNVASMKLADLPIGSRVLTNGFYAANDGGGADYAIGELEEEETADDKFVISIANNKVARLIINGKVDIRTIGATPENDIHDYVIAIVNKGYSCYIPSGEWITSPIKIDTFNSAFIEGVPKRGVGLNGTLIKPIADQDYIIKVGFDNTTSLSNNIHISNIAFNGDGKTLVNALLLNRVQFSDFNNINFYNCKCSDSAMRIRESWECTYDNFYFRTIDAENALTFGTILGSGGISASHFGFFTFENIRGNAVKFENQSGYTTCVFDQIDYECGNVPFDDEVRSDISGDTSDYIEYAVIRIDATNADIVVNNITINNIRMYQFNSVEGNYTRALDAVVINDNANSNVNIEINNISGVGAKYAPYLVNGGTFNKIICNGDSFRSFQRLNFSFDGARIFKYIPSYLADNFANANVTNTQRHLGAKEGELYVQSNAAQPGKIWNTVKLGNEFHFLAKGTGNVTYAGQNIPVDSEDWTWYAKDITSLPEHTENNIYIQKETNVKVKDYYFKG